MSPGNRRQPGRQPAAQKQPKKSNPVGTDLALNCTTTSGEPLPLTYWDLWFAVVAAQDCGGDLSRLAKNLEDRPSRRLLSSDSIARKRSHLRDLQRRLAAAGRTVQEIVSAGGSLPRTELSRARRRIQEKDVPRHEWSEAMRVTLAQRGLQHALRGFWPQFPVSPEPHAVEIKSKFKTSGFYSESQSFGVARKLDRFLDRAKKLLEKNRCADAHALLRAWLTVIVELMEMADDSYGCIGDSFQQGFRTYLDMPLEETGIDETIFFADLLSFLIWENYGLTYKQTEGYFRRLNRAQGDFCLDFLRREYKELQADFVPYRSEAALTLLGQVAAEQDRFELFEELAREMGTQHWQRIVRLVDRAVKKRKRPLADRVFEAALTAGPHLDFLRKKFEQLKEGKWNPDPRK